MVAVVFRVEFKFIARPIQSAYSQRAQGAPIDYFSEEASPNATFVQFDFPKKRDWRLSKSWRIVKVVVLVHLLSDATHEKGGRSRRVDVFVSVSSLL